MRALIYAVINTVILAMLVFFGIRFYPKILETGMDMMRAISDIEPVATDKISELINGSGTLEAVKKEIIAPEPLRNITGLSDTDLTRSGIIALTNKERISTGLPALTENDRLNSAALAKAKDMAARQYFDHVSPSGEGPGDLADNAGYEYTIVGENLAMGNFDGDAGVLSGWMNSPGHRANILNYKYTEMGAAAIEGIYEGRKVWFAVQEFGKPLASCPSADAALKDSIETLEKSLDATSATLQQMRSEIESSSRHDSEYRKLVKQYNELAESYNAGVADLKDLIARYNSQVNAFNSCISQ